MRSSILVALFVSTALHAAPDSSPCEGAASPSEPTAATLPEGVYKGFVTLSSAGEFAAGEVELRVEKTSGTLRIATAAGVIGRTVDLERSLIVRDEDQKMKIMKRYLMIAAPIAPEIGNTYLLFGMDEVAAGEFAHALAQFRAAATRVKRL